MSLLLFGTGGMIEFVLRKVESTKGRLIISGAIVFSFLLIWAEFAVGIMGTPIAGS